MPEPTTYRNKLELSKVNAESQVRQAIQSIGQEIMNAVATLKFSDQNVKLNIDEIVANLEASRDEWLQHLKSAFDSAILSMKTQLSK